MIDVAEVYRIRTGERGESARQVEKAREIVIKCNPTIRLSQIDAMHFEHITVEIEHEGEYCGMD